MPSQDCNTAELHDECFSLFTLSSFFKARSDTLPEEAKQWQYELLNFGDDVRSESSDFVSQARRVRA